MTHTLPPIHTELIPIDRTIGAKDATLVELISLLVLDLMFRSASILRVSDPAIAAKLVADGDLAGVVFTEGLILCRAIAAEFGAFVEFVALVEEGVEDGMGEGQERRKSDKSVLHGFDALCVNLIIGA